MARLMRRGSTSCTISPVSQPLGAAVPTLASFAGDSFYLPSSATSSAILFAFLTQGAMVLGDQTPPTGTVDWWGDDWALVNSLSSGPAPNSFKGFGDSTTEPPSCNSTWTTRTGNSSAPP